MSAPVPDHAGPEASRETVAGYDDYSQIQAAVDRLSDEEFPVEHTTIVGVGVRLVEQVTGRMTYLLAAGKGAAAGAWFGVLIGLFLALFTIGLGDIWLVLTALVWGAIAGAVFGLVSHALKGGARDFSSVSTLRAERYELVVDATYAPRARDILGLPPEAPAT